MQVPEDKDNAALTTRGSVGCLYFGECTVVTSSRVPSMGTE